jgi:hypothetical protein
MPKRTVAPAAKKIIHAAKDVHSKILKTKSPTMVTNTAL